MKRAIAIILCLLMLLPLSACGGSASESSSASQGEPAPEGATPFDTAKAWLDAAIEANELISFEYDGKPFAEFIGDWEKTVEDGKDDAGNTTYTLTYRNAADKVTAWADIILYADYPSIDWVAYFKNEADGDSPVISNILPLDSWVALEDVTLTYAHGSDAMYYDFSPLTADMTAEPTVELGSSGGRSSLHHMPYFDLAGADGKGLLAAIGWTGQWDCLLEASEDRVSMKAGMEETRIALHAGEDMRTPSIVLTFFDNGAVNGHNVFRQLVIDHYTPVDEQGEPITALDMLVCFWGAAGQDNLLSVIDLYDTTGVDYDGFWVDAGWYGDHASVDTYDMAWYNEVGSWYVNEELYPDGLGVVGDALAERDKEFLLWYEPERVMRESEFLEEHPEYLISSSAASFYLFDFSSDEATDFIIDYIDASIKENKVTWYRQDFNCDPINAWLSTDREQGENRVGMTEINYITNLYRYLDELVARNPGLLIDNCASGGRRLDIEMTRRSYPLHKTDYTVSSSDNTSSADGVRNIGVNLAYWLPIFGGSSGVDGWNSTYSIRSMMASGLTIGAVTGNFSWFEDMREQYLACQEMLVGDYYIITQGEGENYDRANTVYMYWLPEEERGYIMAIRPSKSSEEFGEYPLQGLEEDATYLLEVPDTGESITATGAALMNNGLGITLNAKEAQLIFITKQ